MGYALCSTVRLLRNFGLGRCMVCVGNHWPLGEDGAVMCRGGCGEVVIWKRDPKSLEKVLRDPFEDHLDVNHIYTEL